jgi:hypothetical protein
MTYQQHQHAGIAVFIDAERGDDCAGAILLTFVAAFKVFAISEVAVTDD